MKNAMEIMTARFGHDTLLALATVEDGLPHVRTINAWYQDGCFYAVTWAGSGKMRQLAKEPRVAVCGDWFTGHGVGESLGHVLREENAPLMHQLRTAFASWYQNGHINEQDPDTVILRIRLTDGVLFADGQRYDLTF